LGSAQSQAIPPRTKTNENKNMKRISNITYPAFAALALGCFAILSTAQAVYPPPDGGYPNNNTAEGTDALLNLTTGSNNTANGTRTLASNTTGSQNTANGAGALEYNITGSYNTANGFLALYNNNGGYYNTATGVWALFTNNGSNNTA